MIDKISKLLRQAESSDNEAERDVFMQKAQELSTLTGIELHAARMHTERKERREAPTHRVVVVGEKGSRGIRHLLNLFMEIAWENYIQVEWVGTMAQPFAFGFPADIDYAEALYNIVSVQMVEAAMEYLDKGEWRDDTKRVRGGQGGYHHEPVTRSEARESFYQAYTEQVALRLREARVRKEREVASQSFATGDSEVSGQLVLKSKRDESRAYYSEHSKVSKFFDHSGRKLSQSATGAGSDAGRIARLGAQTGIGGTRKGIASE